MPLKITGRHMSVSDRTKEYLDKKVDRLRRLVPTIEEMSFTIEKQKLNVYVEANFRSGKIEAHARTRAEHVNEAIDFVVDKLEAQISKSKKKQSDKSAAARHAARIDAATLQPDPLVEAAISAEAEEEMAYEFEARQVAGG